MKRGITGSYHISTTAGEEVRAFEPYPLPPEPPIDLTGELQQRLEKALVACGRLDGISLLLPDPNLLLYNYIRREAVLSSQIEGTQSSLSDLLLYELEEVPGVPAHDVAEVACYVAAFNHGMERLREGFPLSARLIREVHECLLAHGRGSDKQPGEFRRTQNWIGGTRPGNAHFVPPPAHLVGACISDLERFIHASDPPMPTLVRAALAHVQFETIHPFLDGNGRVGRLIIVLMLHEAGLLRQPLLYLSLYFKQHRALYYELLNSVRMEGCWEEWLDFFLDGVATTAGAAVETARRVTALFADDASRVQGLGRASTQAMRVWEVMRRRPIVSIGHVAQALNASFPSTAKAMGSLEGLGIARELTGRKRDRLYVYDAYMQILSEGMEPLDS